MSTTMHRFNQQSGLFEEVTLSAYKPGRHMDIHQYLLEYPDGDNMIYSMDGENDVTKLYPQLSRLGIFSTIKEAEDYRDSLTSDVT